MNLQSETGTIIFSITKLLANFFKDYFHYPAPWTLMLYKPTKSFHNPPKGQKFFLSFGALKSMAPT